MRVGRWEVFDSLLPSNDAVSSQTLGHKREARAVCDCLALKGFGCHS